MAAATLTNELKLDPCKIDLSSILSKYIGETEKNLDIYTRLPVAGAN
jgi:SpoVK/Ycf46/Vps4 family AAA+-type ATPase